MKTLAAVGVMLSLQAWGGGEAFQNALSANALRTPPAAGRYVFSVSGDRVLLNGQPFKVIGLRLSNALVSDGETQELLNNLDTFKSYGVNTISVYFMGSRFGDVKGYRPDTSLDPIYAARMGRIIEAADARGMVVLVGCLYWSTSQAKADLGSWGQTQANAAVANTVRWLSGNGYRNVFVDPDNEGMASRAKGWDIGQMISAAHAVDSSIMLAFNNSTTPPSNADLLIHHSPKVSGKPWIESEGVPGNAPAGYWGTYSKEDGYYNYIRIGRYTPEMKSDQITRSRSTVAQYAGYMMASTWIQCAPFEGVGGPFMNPGGYSNVADVNANVKAVHPDAGIRWWLEAMRSTYGAWSPPGSGGATTSVTGLTLVNADTDGDIGTLADGQALNLSTLPTRNLSIRANSSPSTVGSVRFAYDGNANYRTENTSPYAIAGDDPRGNYNAWTPALGSHTVTVTPYSGANAGGTAGTALTVRFSVTQGSNVPPSVSITSPANNATFSAGATIAISATAADSDGTVSFVDFYSGTTPLGMDTTPPYGVAWTNVPAGTYTLTAKATDNGAATRASSPVTITVVSSAGPLVASFTLVNADTDSDIGPLAGGQTINLATLPSRRLNVRANTSPATVGSVRFAYDGNANYRIENGAPYALGGNTGTDYSAWTPTVGSHSIAATPYTQANASGTAGTSRTITFTVIEQAFAMAATALPESEAASAEPEGAPTAPEGGGACGATGLEGALLLGLLGAARRGKRRRE